MTNTETSNRLTGRTAVCGSCGTESPSERAGFLTYLGDGSARATETCGFEGRCGYHKRVHQEINPSTGRPGITTHEFTPRGPVEKDSFYCGCRGWD